MKSDMKYMLKHLCYWVIIDETVPFYSQRCACINLWLLDLNNIYSNSENTRRILERMANKKLWNEIFIR